MYNILLAVFFALGIGLGAVVVTYLTVEQGVYLYVFNDKTQLWDRAREETVKSIQCNKIYGMPLSLEILTNINWK